MGVETTNLLEKPEEQYYFHMGEGGGLAPPAHLSKNVM